jgi:Nitrate reductase delta subunit
MASLGLSAPTAAEHTGVFVLSAPPHAAIYLGEPGQLGGEALDRVAGFWRAIGLRPPPDADHLGALLMLYAELADAQAATHRDTTKDRLRHLREALLFEHIWSWAPAYLTAVTRLDVPSLAAWARLTRSALGAEARRAAPPAALPLALRTAPPPVSWPPVSSAPVRSAPVSSVPVSSVAEPGQLLDALFAPVRSGVLLTSADLRAAAAAAGLGYRVGERRYALRAMLDQDAAATLAWLDGHARGWAASHAAQQRVAGPDPRHWWARRAAGTARTLRLLHGGPAASG